MLPGGSKSTVTFHKRDNANVMLDLLIHIHPPTVVYFCCNYTRKINYI
jgi:hypothetical protein